MSRKAILEFLANKNREIINNQLRMMTICELGKLLPDSIAKMRLTSDQVFIYHINQPRIYEKQYSFAALENTIVHMALDLKQDVELKYDDFSYTIKDAFYLKDIREQTFQKIIISLIKEDDIIIGVATLYFDNPDASNPFRNYELVKLIKDINKDIVINWQENINNTIFKHEDYLYWIEYNAMPNKTIFLNENLKQKIACPLSLVNENNQKAEYKKLLKNLNKLPFKTIEEDDITINYLHPQQLTYSEEFPPIYSLTTINRHGFLEDFSLLFYDFSKFDFTFDSEVMKIWKLLIKLFKEPKAKIYYQGSSKSIIIILALKLSSKDANILSNQLLPGYSCILSTSKDIQKTVDLKTLTSYIEEFHPMTYNNNDYMQYLNTITMINLYSDYNYVNRFRKGQVINTKNGSVLAELISSPPFQDLNRLKYEVLTNSINELLEQVYIEKPNCVMIAVSTDSLMTRKTWENIKKITKNGTRLAITVYYNRYIALNHEKFLTVLTNIKSLGIYLLADSSLYLNFSFTREIDFFDAAFVREEEFKEIDSYPSGINNLILDYFIKKYKEIVFDSDQALSIFQHERIYYVKH